MSHAITAHNALAPRANIELGAAINYVKEDTELLPKLGLVGLCAIIPLVGPFVLMGWQRKAFLAARAGEPLPHLAFGEDLGAGFGVVVAMFLNLLPLILVPIIAGIVTAIGGAVLGEISESAAQIFLLVANLGLMLVYLLFALALNLVMPELLRRVFLGHGFVLTKLGESRDHIARAGMGALMMSFVGMLVFNFLGGLGAWLCLVGLIVTWPAATAAVAHLVAQWDASGFQG